MESTEKRKFDEGNGDTQSNAPKRRVIGPSLPPASASAQVAHETSSGSESDESDDDFGPSLPPPDGVSVPVEQSVDRSTSPVHGKKESQRDQWMLAPPDGSDWATKLDPTQLRNRKFQTGRSAGSGGSKQVDSSWVETPEERMRRLGDAVMGVGSPSSDTKPKASNTARAKSMEGRIKKYNVSIPIAVISDPALMLATGSEWEKQSPRECRSTQGGRR